MRSPLGIAGAVWGVGGLLLSFVSALARLGEVAVESLNYPLAWYHVLAYVLSITFMGYSEGYKGFQKAFSPRVVARAEHLSRHPTILRVALAPVFCMGLFGANRKRLIVSWSITLGVVALIIAVKTLTAQPWRGIIDAGVVVGLGWGTLAIVAFALKTLAGSPPRVALDLPVSESHYPQ